VAAVRLAIVSDTGIISTCFTAHSR
jgi:hypothetical protein